MKKPKRTTVVNRRDYDGDGVNIMRGTIWGNKYKIGRDGIRAEVVAKHRRDVLANPEMIALIKKCLTGKTLICCCVPLECHGDVYAEICNGELKSPHKAILEFKGDYHFANAVVGLVIIIWVRF
jgi:hypothetical protein